MTIKLHWIVALVILANVGSPWAESATPLFDRRVPMRDGVELSTDVWLPSIEGTFPAILLRTPYLKAPQFERYRLANYVKSGYAVVLQDVRGRGDSDGVFDFYFPEGRDGADTIEWIAGQSWCNGSVGMCGGSYMGAVQWLAAREKPSHLVCILPTAASGRMFDELPYVGGALNLAWALPWLNEVSGRSAQGASATTLDWMALFKHRPLDTADGALGRSIPLYRAIFDHPMFDDHWKRIQLGEADFETIDLPALTVTGWFDGDQAGALHYWRGMRTHSPARDNQYLIIGPWTHAETYLGGNKKVGTLEFTPESAMDIQAERLRFFEDFLKSDAPAAPPIPRTRVYVTGINEWREYDEYPPRTVEPTALYLSGDGHANTREGDGRLSWNLPEDEPPDTFRYDPANPVPSLDTATDHRSVEMRPDVLVYTSEPLTDPVEILGAVQVLLTAASDGMDTDFTAKLLDVHPDGKAIALGPRPTGVKRARFRAGYVAEHFLVPGEPVSITVDLFDMGHRFLTGHRIRVEISSSDFPGNDPNLNTGLPIGSDVEGRVATQTIFHDRERASHILLPVLPLNPKTEEHE